MLINYKREGLHHAGNMTLMPGLNRVRDEDFKEASKWPAFKALIDEGLIEVVADKKGKEVDLSKLSTSQTVDLVKATVDKKMLEEILDGETKGQKRKAVLEALKEQFEAIDPTKNPA